jgi:hypothetical protein
MSALATAAEQSAAAATQSAAAMSAAASPPPEVSQMSLTAPISVPGTTTLAGLLALIYTLSADLAGATQTFQLIDGCVMLVSFSGGLNTTCRIKFEMNAIKPSTAPPLYSY